MDRKPAGYDRQSYFYGVDAVPPASYRPGVLPKAATRMKKRLNSLFTSQSLPPKEILLQQYESQVSPWLKARGFTFSRSRFTYRLELGEFVQHISVFLSSYNSSSRMVFWSAFNVSSPTYDRWLSKQERPPFKAFIGGCIHHNIPGWNEPGDYSTSIDFTDPATREQVVEKWMRRCEQVGLTFLNSLCSWEGAAQDLLQHCWHFDRAADFCLIAGLPEQAILALEAGITALQNQELLQPPTEHAFLIAKRKLEARKRSEAVAALTERIRELRANKPDPPR